MEDKPKQLLLWSRSWDSITVMATNCFHKDKNFLFRSLLMLKLKTQCMKPSMALLTLIIYSKDTMKKAQPSQNTGDLCGKHRAKKGMIVKVPL
jgi:hypothetical protein